MKQKIKKIQAKVRRTKSEINKDSIRITNENISEHRKEVINAGKKFKYPIAVTKNRLVAVSIFVSITSVLVFFGVVTTMLYKTKTTSVFLERLTQVIPFPIARIGSDFVSYNDYLFDVNHYEHFYVHQQKLDLNSPSGQEQMKEYKKRAFEKTINDAYIKQIAKEKNITVSDKEVDDAIAILKKQNRLGASDQEFKTILAEYWNWTVSDFKRSLKAQLLNQKVLEALDVDTKKKADDAYTKLQTGTAFDQLASQVSEDLVSKSRGGSLGVIEKSNSNISPFTVETLYGLQPGQYSKPVNIGYALEIVKNDEIGKDGKAKASHIIFNFKNINDFLNPLKEQKKARLYVAVP